MIVVGNWKSCMLTSAMHAWLADYSPVENITQVILSPSPYLKWMAEYKKMNAQDWMLGAQDLGVHDAGPTTGEITRAMLEDCDVQVVCIGHTETRRALKLTCSDIKKRLAKVSTSRMVPLLCIADPIDGESEDAWMDVLPEVLPSELWIAYEPQWAIGHSQAATPEMVAEHITMLDALFKNRYNDKATSDCVRWMYGGAVNVSNIRSFVALDVLDGFLVGRSSLQNADWSALIQCI